LDWRGLRLKAPGYHYFFKSPNHMVGVRSDKKVREYCLYISLLAEICKNLPCLPGLEVFY
jgi:hypothetical protein